MTKGKHPDKALLGSGPDRHEAGALRRRQWALPDRRTVWRKTLRTIVQGKRRDIGLGGCKLVTLAEAREMALTFRKIAREGGDPLAERRKQRTVIPTFEQAARSVHAEHLPTWKNLKHGAQWINTLSQYVFPIIGKQPVDKIETSDVLKVLSPIWLIKPETARRVRQRIGTVLDV